MKQLRLWTVVITAILSIGSVLVFTGCQKERIYLSPEEANQKAFAYLILSNNQYVLNMSSKQADNLGISPFDFNRMMREVIETNQKIRELQTKGNGEPLPLIDPQNVDIQINTRTVWGDDPEWELLNGTITTTDERPSGRSVFVPKGYNNLHCETFSSALLGWNSVKVYAGGQVIGATPFFVGPFGGSCDIKLPVSNTNISIEFSTASSGGGSCAYRLEKK